MSLCSWTTATFYNLSFLVQLCHCSHRQCSLRDFNRTDKTFSYQIKNHWEIQSLVARNETLLPVYKLRTQKISCHCAGDLPQTNICNVTQSLNDSCWSPFYCIYSGLHLNHQTTSIYRSICVLSQSNAFLVFDSTSIPFRIRLNMR